MLTSHYVQLQLTKISIISQGILNVKQIKINVCSFREPDTVTYESTNVWISL